MRNIIFLIFFFAKVLSVYGLVEPKTDFEKLNNFFNKYIFDDYLNTTNKNLVNITIANDGKSITSIKINLENIKPKSKTFLFSEFPILPSLEILSIYAYNPINVELHKKIFEEYPNLKELHLKKFNITKISEDISPYSPIEKLYLIMCNINEFPHQLKALENLKELDLSQNHILSIPNTNSYPKLENLLITENEIKTLVVPENIKILNASGNPITELTKESKNGKLEELIIKDNNEILRIDDDFFNGLDQLKIIDFQKSNIVSLPDSIFGLKNVEKLNLSVGNESGKMDIIKFMSDNDNDNNIIKKCYFNDEKISCYQKSACAEINDQTSDEKYNDRICSEEIIEEHIKNIYPHSNKTLTVIVVLLVIILGIVGCLWMYKIYQKRKQLKDADVIVSPTKNTSNYYDEIINNNIGANEKSSNRNTQISFPDTPINSNIFVSPISQESHTSISLNNVQNLNDLTANSTSLNNNMGRSPSVPVEHTTRPIMRSPTAPSGHSTIPMPRSRSLSTRYSVSNSINSYTNSNGNISMDMTNLMVNNNSVIGNEKNKMLYNNQPYSHYSMAGSSSSVDQKVIMSNSNNEPNIQELEEIRLKKKILQEREMMEKHNFYDNYDDQDDPDNNLPPYSEI